MGISDVVITFCALWSCVHRSVLKPNTKGLYGGDGGSFPRIEQYFVTVPRTDVASLECESQNTRLFVGASISNTPPDMPRHVSDDEEPLEDKTAALTLHNKRTERQQRKKVTRDKKRDAIVNFPPSSFSRASSTSNPAMSSASASSTAASSALSLPTPL
jgi:hypothetical protein